MKWQAVQDAQSSVADYAAAYQDAVNQAHTDAQAALTEFRQRLGYDLDLAHGTLQVLQAISRSTSCANQYPEYTTQVWAHREELEPLAQAYGFTIVESDVTKNIGSAVPA